MKKTSLKFQFGLAISLLVLFIVGGTAFFISNQERKNMEEQMVLRSSALLKNLAGNSEEILLISKTPDIMTLGRFVDQLKQEPGVHDIWISGPDKNLLAHSDTAIQNKIDEASVGKTGYVPQDKYFMTAVNYGKPEILRQYDPVKNLYQISFPIITGGNRLGTVGLSFSKKIIDEAVNRALRSLLLIAGIGLILGIFISLFLVTIITKPVNILAQGAKIIGSGNLDYEITLASRNEIGDLAVTFNHMSKSLKLAQANMVEKERMEKELQIAREIQLSLIPKKCPVLKGFDFGATYRSAKEVGGDYYDFIRVDNDNIGLVVADVSGKGVPASVIMAITRSTLRTQAPLRHSAYETLSRTNRILKMNLYTEMFVTAFYGILNIRNRTLNFAKAGHNYLCLFRKKSGTNEILKSKGTALGLGTVERFDKTLEEKEVSLDPGDIIVQYSDGVTEAKNIHYEDFTSEKLYEVILKNSSLGAQGLVDAINREVVAFAGDAPQSDDISIMAVKIL